MTTLPRASTVSLVSKFTDVKGASARTGLPTPSLYRLIAERRFPAVKIGRRLLIPVDELEKYLEGSRLATADEALARNHERLA